MVQLSKLEGKWLELVSEEMTNILYGRIPVDIYKDIVLCGSVAKGTAVQRY